MVAKAMAPQMRDSSKQGDGWRSITADIMVASEDHHFDPNKIRMGGAECWEK